MSRRLIRYIGGKAGFHPWLALTLVFAVTGVALWAALTRYEIVMDVAALLPEDSEVYQNRRQAHWDFGAYDYDFIYCVLEVREDAAGDIRENPGRFLKSIQEEVEYALDDQRFFRPRTARFGARDLSSLRQNEAALLALLTDSDHDLIENTILPGRASQSVRLAAARAGNPGNGAGLDSSPGDPFGLEQILRSRSVLQAGPLRSDPGDGVHLSSDGRMMLVVLWPLQPSTNILDATRIHRFLEETREALFARNPEWRESLQIDFFGPHIESAEGVLEIRGDVMFTSIISLLAVMILFFAAFRQPEALIFVGLPLVVGVIWTLGFASLFVDRITQVTFPFVAILLGLGIDFSIHLYNRYLEEMRAGARVDKALRQAITHTGPTILAGAITTGLAFFALALTQFQGFRELGLFGGIGIFMSLLAVATTVPPLMVVFSGMSARVRGPVASLGLKKITYTVQSYPRMAVAGGLCIAAFLGIHATNASFHEDFQTFRQPSVSYERLTQRIVEQFDVPSNQVLVIIQEESLEEALRTNDRVYQRIQAARDTYGLVGVDSLRMIYPSPETQLASLQRLERLPTDRIAQEIRLASLEHPELPEEYFNPFLERLRHLQAKASEALEKREPLIGLERTDDRSFVEAVRGYVSLDPEQGVYRIITRVYPPKDSWVDEVPSPFVNAISDGLRHPPVILGSAVVSSEINQMIVEDLTKVVLIVLIAVVLYLAFYFRSFGRAFLSMIPVAFAMLCILGAMELLGLRLNYVNLIAIPLIVGIGVDSGIHLLSRFFENDGHNMRLAIERTGRAIVITSLTTIFAFGSLSLAGFSGVREIGIMLIVGTMATLFASLVFLPSVLRLLDPRYTFSGGPGDEIG